MTPNEPHMSERELLPLTDSLSSRVRWRVCDYEAIVKAEIDLMLNAAGLDAEGAQYSSGVSRDGGRGRR